jgi:hypothetical protein
MSNDTRVKLFVRLAPDRALAFQEAIKKHGASLTQQDVLEQLVENYLAHEQEGQIRHLDGSICPISSLITGLVDAVGAQWKMLEAFRAGVKYNPPP